ncbi:uncharacterized protein LOC127266091 [Andrographis paniculata]|uniref:uncharacterized protein LOC127266091 n=1 Tax=Andrographis paniculata TaxID=175694 RepID=UPI0021E713BA|nr:uncharacterized protein LOC127266091 [Andrographis paniculata]
MAGESKIVAAADVSASRVPKSTVESAVAALLKYKAAQSAGEKPQLLPQDEYIYLNLTMKKIPSRSRTNPYKIPLSHPILDSSSELCLIVDDRPQSPTPPSDQIKKLIKSQDIPISKVIKISKLKANYKAFEAKRKLCNSYDMFLVDRRVVHLLPKLIGKEFFRKKKLPLPVDLSKKNLKSQVERALGSALLLVRTGTCSVMKVGKVAMEKDEIIENVIDAVNGAVANVPKKWDGVRSLHLKLFDSVSLPIYQAMPDVKLKIEGLKRTEDGVAVVKIGDEGEDAAEKKDGDSEIKKKKKNKGRIHEVRYMDDGEVAVSDEDNELDDGEDVESDDDKLDDIEEARNEEIDELVGEKSIEGNEFPEKRRSKRIKANTSKGNGLEDMEKPAKKKAKLGKKGKEIGVTSGVKANKKSKLDKESNEGIVGVKNGKHKKRSSK